MYKKERERLHALRTIPIIIIIVTHFWTIPIVIYKGERGIERE